MTTEVVVVAEVRFYREGLAGLLRDAGGFSVLATATGADEARPLLRALEPDLVVVAADPAARPELVRAIAACLPAARMVVIGVADDHPDVLPLAEAGVAGYVTSDASAEELVAVVRSVARGEASCPPRITAALLQRVASLARNRRVETKAGSLTARELEIVALIDRGMSNKQIAADLRIEVATVKNHVHNILEKLHVARRGQAAAAVRREI